VVWNLRYGGRRKSRAGAGLIFGGRIGDNQGKKGRAARKE
jgi:hypothetical protein